MDDLQIVYTESKKQSKHFIIKAEKIYQYLGEII